MRGTKTGVLTDGPARVRSICMRIEIMIDKELKIAQATLDAPESAVPENSDSDP